MATQVKVTDILIPRKNEYVRGTIKRENLVRIASAFTGRGWPEIIPPVSLRRFPKPVKRGKKEYKYGAVEGVHRTTLALWSLNDKTTKKLNEILKSKGMEPWKGGKLETIPAVISDMSDTEADVEQLRANLAHGLLLDKKHRDGWVRHLIKNRKLDVPRIAKLLHLTERSVYRMAKGEQTKQGPRKKAAKRSKAAENGHEAEKFTPEGYFKALRSMAKEAKSNAPALTKYLKDNHEKIAEWLDPLVDVLNLTAAMEATPERKAS